MPFGLLLGVFNLTSVAFLLGVLGVALVAALIEMQRSDFQLDLGRNWHRVKVDLARAELRNREKQLISGKNRQNIQRDRLRRIQLTQRDFFEELKRMDGGSSQIQQDLIAQALRAFSRYYELLQKEQRLSGLLESTNRGEIERDIARLERQADATSSEARAQYLRAAEFRKQELRSLERADQLSTLLQAHMDALESALATMRTRMINTSVWDASGVGNAYVDLTQELLALERAFAEVAEIEKDPLLEFERLE